MHFQEVHFMKHRKLVSLLALVLAVVLTVKFSSLKRSWITSM